MSGESVILSTLFLDKPPRCNLPVLSAHSQKRKNMVVEIFLCQNLQERICARLGGSISSLLASQVASIAFLFLI